MSCLKLQSQFTVDLRLEAWFASLSTLLVFVELMFHRESFHSKDEIRRLLVIESKVTPKVYSVEVTHGFLGDGEPLMVCNPREEMVIKIDNTRWVFYQIFDSILGFLCTVPHRVLTATSQGKACCWKTEAETKISTEKCFLLKVLDLSS